MAGSGRALTGQRLRGSVAPMLRVEDGMHWMARVALGLAIGYALGAVAGYASVQAFSGNVHDRELEAAMTAAFATGPLGAALGVAISLVMGRRA